MQRFDESALADKLPPKHCTVLWCRLSDSQKQILDQYRADMSDHSQLIDRARTLSTHPDALNKTARGPIDLAQGPKLAVLFHIVRQCQRLGEKLVVFSFDVATHSKCYL